MDEFKKLNAPHGSNARLNNESNSFDNENNLNKSIIFIFGFKC